MEKLDKAVRNFINNLCFDDYVQAKLRKVTVGREPLPKEVYENLVLTDEQQEKLYITETDKEYGKLGSSFVASVLSVHPDNYSDEQYNKVLNKGLHERTLEGLRDAIRVERGKHRIDYDDCYED